MTSTSLPRSSNTAAFLRRHARSALRKSALAVASRRWRNAWAVRLLQRTTRALALTEAGQRFFERCVATVEGAQAAYDSVAELRREPVGLVRLSSLVL
jgi:DNA-binding transcriptional LysR family regulator